MGLGAMRVAKAVHEATSDRWYQLEKAIRSALTEIGIYAAFTPPGTSRVHSGTTPVRGATACGHTIRLKKFASPGARATAIHNRRRPWYRGVERHEQESTQDSSHRAGRPTTTSSSRSRRSRWGTTSSKSRRHWAPVAGRHAIRRQAVKMPIGAHSAWSLLESAKGRRAR
jgi:hypothetical protein